MANIVFVSPSAAKLDYMANTVFVSPSAAKLDYLANIVFVSPSAAKLDSATWRPAVAQGIIKIHILKKRFLYTSFVKFQPNAQQNVVLI